MNFGERQIELQNEVVKLRPIEMGDVESILYAGNDPDIWPHLSMTILSQKAAEQFVQKALQDRAANKTYTFVIIDQQSGKIVGSTSFLDIEPGHKRIEIGTTWHHPSVWRTNINSNCKYLLLQYVFEQLQYNRVQIKTGHENIRSQKAIERLGAIKEGILRNHMIKKDGTIRHTVMYSITSEEWSTVRRHFEQNLLLKR